MGNVTQFRGSSQAALSNDGFKITKLEKFHGRQTRALPDNPQDGLCVECTTAMSGRPGEADCREGGAKSRRFTIAPASSRSVVFSYGCIGNSYTPAAVVGCYQKDPKSRRKMRASGNRRSVGRVRPLAETRPAINPSAGCSPASQGCSPWQTTIALILTGIF